MRHSNAPVGSKQFFDEVEDRKYFVEPHIPDFVNFSVWGGKRVLEIGCGIGTNATNFATAGAIYTGVELSLESLELARKRFEVYGLSGGFIKGNAEVIDRLLVGEIFNFIHSVYSTKRQAQRRPSKGVITSCTETQFLK